MYCVRCTNRVLLGKAGPHQSQGTITCQLLQTRSNGLDAGRVSMTSTEDPQLGDLIRHQRIYTNPSARRWTSHHNLDSRIEPFHRSLPEYAPTPLVSLPSVAQRFSVAHVLLKDESYRLDLKAFKILGASWGTYRGLAERLGLPLTVSIDELGRAAKAADIGLFAATEGNHGRAVARMAKWLNVKAHIFVPENMDKSTKDRIASEGAQVEIVEGDYDLAVSYADQEAAVSKGLLIQDNAWPGYEDIPTWISEGYSTMLQEADRQVMEVAGKSADLVITPVGVGSLAQAVITHYKTSDRSTALLAVEANTAPCLLESLKQGSIKSISTTDTIMCGLNCGTVSSTAWPLMRDGLDTTTTVTDLDSHRAMSDLQSLGFHVGPCGAAPLAALKNIGAESLGLNKKSVVVLLCTEGTRDYVHPVES